MSARTVQELLTEACGHFERAIDYRAHSTHPTQIVVDAVCMRLAAGIESLSRLDPAVREELFGAEWAVMWATRNRIAHGYLLVNDDIILRTVQDDLPPLVKRLRGIVDSSD